MKQLVVKTNEVITYASRNVVMNGSDSLTATAKAVELAKTLKPVVVVMDLMMPRMNGADATAAIKSECPGAKVLVLTTFSDSGDMRRALDEARLAMAKGEVPIGAVVVCKDRIISRAHKHAFPLTDT